MYKEGLSKEVFYFSALPDKGGGTYLKELLNTQLKESLLHITDVCSEVIPEPSLLKIRTYLDQDFKEGQFSPFLYYLNENLISLIELNKKQAVIKSFQDLESEISLPHMPKILDYSSLSIWQKRIFQKVSEFELPNKPIIKPSRKTEFLKTSSLIESTEFLLKKYAKNLWGEAKTLLACYLIFDSDYLIAGSSQLMLGLMYVRDDFVSSQEEMIATIVHEAAHMYLFSLSFIDPLLKNSFDERYEAPLRKDKRPLIGIYHATFVISRILYVFQLLLEKKAPEVNLDIISSLYADYKARYEAGLLTVLKNGKFTKLGRDIIESTKTLVNLKI